MTRIMKTSNGAGCKSDAFLKEDPHYKDRCAKRIRCWPSGRMPRKPRTSDWHFPLNTFWTTNLLTRSKEDLLPVLLSFVSVWIRRSIRHLQSDKRSLLPQLLISFLGISWKIVASAYQYSLVTAPRFCSSWRPWRQPLDSVELDLTIFSGLKNC